jgi:hypothetical protein
MESSATRVLVVANQTAATPDLVEAVRERAARGPTTFTLVVPKFAHGLQKVVDPEDASSAEAEAVIADSLPALSDAAGSKVVGIVGAPAPITAIEDAINELGFDEIIISTLPHRFSRWLRLDLPSKASGLGLPITVVTAKERAPEYAGD